MEELLNLHVTGAVSPVRWGAMTVPVSGQPEIYKKLSFTQL